MAGQPPTLQYVDFPIFNALIPEEGPKVVPFNFDWQTSPSYAVDLQNQQARAVITMVQTIWIDNSLNDFPVSIRFDVVGQNLKAPPRWQGYFPVMVSNPPRFVVSSAGSTASTQISLMNVPFPGAAWSSLQANGRYDSNGNLLVSDVILESGVQGGHYQSDMYVRSNSDGTLPLFKSCFPSFVSATAAGNTLIRAAGGANINQVFNAIDITLTGNAALAAPGNLTIQLREGATTVLTQWIVSLPAVANTVIIPVCQLSGIQTLTFALNQALNLNLSAALTAGSCNVNLYTSYTTAVRT